MGRDQKASDSWVDAAALELLPLLALKRQAAAAGLAAHQADARQRPHQLLAYAGMLREIARRTGESETLAQAASAAARAAREARGDVLAAARLEQAGIARLGGELFADPEGYEAAEDFLKASEAAPMPNAALAARRTALRAGLNAGAALATADVDQAVHAAGDVDAAVQMLEQGLRGPVAGRVEAAALRCDRADFLIGFGARLKDKALLVRAEADLSQLASFLDPHYLPLSWARAESLRGAALAGLGDLTGDPKALADSVRVMAAAAEHVDFDHSPLDRARTGHGLGLALTALAEATEDDGLYDHAIAAYDQALAHLDALPGLALRALAAHDRAACLARRAERSGDARALARAEAAFRDELKVRSAATDPVAWAVTQLALIRIYVAQAELPGGATPPASAAVALTEALDVFTERGLKTLAEAGQDLMVRLKGASGLD